jgi:hypothetical protein
LVQLVRDPVAFNASCRAEALLETCGGGGADVGAEMGTSCTLLKERIETLDETTDSRTLAWNVDRKQLIVIYRRSN